MGTDLLRNILITGFSYSEERKGENDFIYFSNDGEKNYRIIDDELFVESNGWKFVDTVDVVLHKLKYELIRLTNLAK